MTGIAGLSKVRIPPPGRTAPWLAGGTEPSLTPANSFGRRLRWKSLTSIKNNWPPAGASAMTPYGEGLAVAYDAGSAI